MSDSVPAWIPSAKFEEAVTYAIRVHGSQARKCGTVPYLSHLFGVASLVMEDGGSEDETIAALLHDAAEDQGGEARLRDIEERFGKTIADIVEGCSDTLEKPKPPWRQRRERYLEHLATASSSVLRVSLADKLHNARAMVRDHAVYGDKFWERFTAGKREQQWFHEALCDTFSGSDTTPSPMLQQLKAAVSELFG